jgi:hypothetical protein
LEGYDRASLPTVTQATAKSREDLQSFLQKADFKELKGIDATKRPARNGITYAPRTPGPSDQITGKSAARKAPYGYQAWHPALHFAQSPLVHPP